MLRGMIQHCRQRSLHLFVVVFSWMQLWGFLLESAFVLCLY
jgi:hypothetical protein